ncbi:uncharacterized protein V6R79_014537 [Siganus canaliculatus]
MKRRWEGFKWRLKIWGVTCFLLNANTTTQHLPQREGVRHRCFVNNTEDERLTAAETGSRYNDCCPWCTLGNNQPSFVIIAVNRHSARSLWLVSVYRPSNRNEKGKSRQRSQIQSLTQVEVPKRVQEHSQASGVCMNYSSESL